MVTYGTRRSYTKKRNFRRRAYRPKSTIPRAPAYRQLKTFAGTRIGAIVENYSKITYNPGNTSPQFAGTTFGGTNYVNITALIQGSTTWANLYAEFAYYRIREIRMEMYGMATSGMNIDNALMTIQSPGPCRLAFYPNIISTDVATSPAFADDNFVFNPLDNNKQNGIIRIPKQFTAGPNSQGLNEWNAVNQIANLYGQISITDPALTSTISTVGSVDVIAGSIKFMFIIDFCHTNS
jgi:hypothetical protein